MGPIRTRSEQSTDERRAAVIEQMKMIGKRTSAFLDGSFNEDNPPDTENCMHVMMEKLYKLKGNTGLEEVMDGVVAGVGKTLTYLFHKKDHTDHQILMEKVFRVLGKRCTDRVLSGASFEVENVDKSAINNLIDEIHEIIKITEECDTDVVNIMLRKRYIAEAARVIEIELDPSILYGKPLEEFRDFFNKFQIKAKNKLSDALYYRLLKDGPPMPAPVSANLLQLTERLRTPPPDDLVDLIDRLGKRPRSRP